MCCVRGCHQGWVRRRWEWSGRLNGTQCPLVGMWDWPWVLYGKQWETIHIPAGVLKESWGCCQGSSTGALLQLLRPDSTEKDNFCQLSSLQAVLPLECFLWQTEPVFPMGVGAIWQMQKTCFIFWRWTFLPWNQTISHTCTALWEVFHYSVGIHKIKSSYSLSTDTARDAEPQETILQSIVAHGNI